MWCGDTRALCAQQWFGWAMNVYGYRSSGAALCCAWIPQIGVHIRRQLLLLTRWLLPNRVHVLVQDEWQGAQLV